MIWPSSEFSVTCELQAEMSRGEGEGPDRGRLRPHHRGLALVLVGVVGELRQFGVDVMPGKGVLARLDEPGRDGLARLYRLAEGYQEPLIVPVVTHLARLPGY